MQNFDVNFTISEFIIIFIEFFYLFIIKGKILAIPKLTIVEISFLGSIQELCVHDAF